MFPCIPPPPHPYHLIILVPSHNEMKTVLQHKLWQFNLMLKLKKDKNWLGMTIYFKLKPL